jgi:glycopeptide antibiotics resistance protein
MLYLAIKAALSGVIIALVSEVARKYPGFGALIASLPLISILGMIWLWRDTNDPVRLADHAQATFWFVLPSLPMFLLVPMLLKRGVAFWPSLAAGCMLTILLYTLTTWALARTGVRL